MEETLKILLGILAGMMEGFSQGEGDETFESKVGLVLWELIGFVGGSAWLIISLGRLQWENRDWRAVSTGLALLAGGLMLLIRFGLNHYAAASVA
jgi:hypothetical protein